jgi:ATP-binding cassette, subfamily B, bacterial
MSIVKFENVTFGYSDDKKILDNVSFEMQLGKTYALIGATGGGKSTTASLMAGLYEPNSGQIIIDNQSIQDYSANELYKKIGFILQDPFLFSGTLLENIIYGNDEYLDEFKNRGSNSNLEKKVSDMLDEKGLLNLLKIFDEGLLTKVTNNSENISLGQKQIVNFLRVLLRQPKLLILDEATANLDTVTENLLQEILDKLPKDSITKVIIAHRLNTIKNADYVYLVGGGKVELKQ